MKVNIGSKTRQDETNVVSETHQVSAAPCRCGRAAADVSRRGAGSRHTGNVSAPSQETRPSLVGTGGTEHSCTNHGCRGHFGVTSII